MRLYIDKKYLYKKEERFYQKKRIYYYFSLPDLSGLEGYGMILPESRVWDVSLCYVIKTFEKKSEDNIFTFEKLEKVKGKAFRKYSYSAADVQKMYNMEEQENVVSYLKLRDKDFEGAGSLVHINVKLRGDFYIAPDFIYQSDWAIILDETPDILYCLNCDLDSREKIFKKEQFAEVKIEERFHFGNVSNLMKKRKRLRALIYAELEHEGKYREEIAEICGKDICPVWRK